MIERTSHPGAGSLQKFEYNVLPRFSKVGPPELIFGLKLASPEQSFAKICVSGAKI